MNRSNSRIPVWPGIKSVKEVAMPMKGLFIALSGTPVPFNNARCGVRSNPWVMASLRLAVMS